MLAHQLLEQVAGARELDRELGLDDLDPAFTQGGSGAPHGLPGRVCLVPAEGLEAGQHHIDRHGSRVCPQPESARFRGARRYAA